MGLNDQVSAERIHIGFFGLRNAGKSSLVNAVTGQSLSVISDVAGTTTDPVRKAMEILPIGPVVIIDTPGFDDEGTLGELRVEKTKEVLRRTDIAVLVTDVTKEMSDAEAELISIFEERKLPYIVAYNKADLAEEVPELKDNEIAVSALEGKGIYELKEMLSKFGKKESEKRIIADILNPGDNVILVIPIDESAPKGRLILPQQQTLRDILDAGCTASVCQPEELAGVLDNLKNPPAIVVTDSQAFGKVNKIVPEDILLTSFSILFARYKGELDSLIAGAKALESLEDGDKVLISEGCTHHRQCNDIGSVKIPKWIKEFTDKDIEIELSSGMEFPDDMSKFKTAIHCGGCMLNEKEMKYRIKHCKDAGVPVVNYGIAIAKMHGILDRSIKPFV